MWWLAGIPLAWALIGLSVAGDQAWKSGSPRFADLTYIARLALYWLWFMSVWKCSRNVEHRLWTVLARGALFAGLAVTALT